MFHTVVIVALLYPLSKGADFLVDEVVNLSILGFIIAATGLILGIVAVICRLPVFLRGRKRIGISQSIIVATFITFGTSLPEFMNAITSVTKGGFMVTPNFYKIQIPVMLIILTFFRYFYKNKGNVINKKEGLFLVGIYAVYIFLSYNGYKFNSYIGKGDRVLRINTTIHCAKF